MAKSKPDQPEQSDLIEEAMPVLRLRDQAIPLDQPRVMGVVNVTPDSFSDGGRFLDPAVAVEHACRLATEGADIIDIGGMSSRPGAEEVAAKEELERVLPVLEEVAERLEVPVSVDTCRSEVAEAVLARGARMINDITALGDPAMAELVAETGAGLVLMHMQGTPRSMQCDPHYEDVVTDIGRFLAERAERARDAGVSAEAICLDPGIGFGKTLEHNLEILRRLGELAELGYPLLIGTSRKSFIGKVLGAPVEERLVGSLASLVVARLAGASLFRVHDVAETRQALALTEAISRSCWPVPTGTPTR